MKQAFNLRRRWTATTAVCIVSTMANATVGFAAGGTGRSSWDLRSHPNRFLAGLENKIEQDIGNLLNKGGKDSSVPWENPQTGARGTVTPIAAAYSQDGSTCHGFLASYERDGASSWLQGEACRATAKGKWEVRNLKPWQRT